LYDREKITTLFLKCNVKTLFVFHDDAIKYFCLCQETGRWKEKNATSFWGTTEAKHTACCASNRKRNFQDYWTAKKLLSQTYYCFGVHKKVHFYFFSIKFELRNFSLRQFCC